jgi:flagellar biogenesis protein FliO
MDPGAQPPFCPVPPETVSDVVPMLVVLGIVFAAGWLYRRWRKRR